MGSDIIWGFTEVRDEIEDVYFFYHFSKKLFAINVKITKRVGLFPGKLYEWKPENRIPIGNKDGSNYRNNLR